ncbi:hypothetical protein N7470_009025 [Penicillium chermesinum]|nr:hypothetical protein N7470_009025 [Penicillium chermesinum]
MAHQAHNIPWHLLASNLRWEAPGPFDNFATNLYPRGKPHQANDLNRFVDAFVRNLDEHAVCERRKYPEKYDIPQPSDLILDEATVRKIAPTVRRWRGKWARGSECPSGVCNLRDGLEACECEPIPSEERFMSAFLRPLVDNECYQFYEENGDAFFNLEVVKTLLLYGEMDAILRVCAHPDICLRRWFSRAPCYDTGGDDLGWNLICYKMLSVYICLNVAYAFPELWDFNSGRTPERDYRNTRFYQKTLINCAIGRRWDESVLATFPHRRFFDMDSSRESLETNTGNGEHWLLNRELHRRRRYKFKGYPASGDLLSSSTDRYKEDHGLYGRVPIHEFLDLWLPGAGSHKPWRTTLMPFGHFSVLRACPWSWH